MRKIPFTGIRTQVPTCRKTTRLPTELPGRPAIIQTKSRQTQGCDPGGFTGRIRACPFLGGWHALLCGEIFIWAPHGARGWSVFWKTDDLKYHFPREVQAVRYAERFVVDRCFYRSQADTGSRQSPTARSYVSCGDKRMSENTM